MSKEATESLITFRIGFFSEKGRRHACKRMDPEPRRNSSLVEKKSAGAMRRVILRAMRMTRGVVGVVLFLAGGGAYVACVGDTSTSGPNGVDGGGVDAAAVDGSSASDGSSATDGSSSGVDAGSSDAAGVDADAAVLPPCDLAQPFGAPTPISELNTGTEEATPRLTPDELTVYFQQIALPDAGVIDGGGGYDLLVATRATRTATFGAPVPLSTINTPSDEYDPTVTGDNLTLFFSRNSMATSNDIWTATRSSTVGNFANATELSINTVGYDQHPYTSADGLTLYFASDRSGTSQDLFKATRTAMSQFAVDQSGVFAAVNGVSTYEGFPTVSSDQKTLYFTSDRTGGGAKGGYDIWIATRGSTADPFGSVTNLSAVNSAVDDFPSFISADGCRLYLTSGTAGAYKVYVAKR
jgi:hypothetical protein